MKRLILSAILFFIIIAISGCTAHHTIELQNSYKPNKNVKIKVAKITNKTGFKYKIPIEKMLKTAFIKQLAANNLLAKNDFDDIVIINVDIIEYSQGSAFKRWLMPGWGKTALTITAKLYNKNKEIGTLKATREITAGGGFTIGAWKYVFDDLAKDVIEDFKKEFIK